MLCANTDNCTDALVQKKKRDGSTLDSFTFIFMYHSQMIYHFSNYKLFSFLNHKSRPAGLSRCRCQNVVVQQNELNNPRKNKTKFIYKK